MDKFLALLDGLLIPTFSDGAIKKSQPPTELKAAPRARKLPCF
jgi:hypothetical protein